MQVLALIDVVAGDACTQ
jgi:beta-glucanase (GH16 family)